MKIDTYAGIPLEKRINGKPFYYHSRYRTKRDAEYEATAMRTDYFMHPPRRGQARKLVRVVPVNKGEAKYAIYTRGK